MTKDEALALALEALELHGKQYPHMVKGYCLDAITAIKQARALDKMAENDRALGLDYEPVLKDNSNYRYDPPVAEPVAWKWHQAPVKTSWGHDMVVADLSIDKDNTVSVYCERDQTAKVEAMLNPPAQPAPVQEPDHSGELTIAYMSGVHRGKELAAQRQWVGLTDEEVYPLANEHLHYQMEGYEVGGIYNLARAIEAKLKEKNT